MYKTKYGQTILDIMIQNKGTINGLVEFYKDIESINEPLFDLREVSVVKEDNEITSFLDAKSRIVVTGEEVETVENNNFIFTVNATDGTFTFPQRSGTFPSYIISSTTGGEEGNTVTVTSTADPTLFTFNGGIGTYTIKITGSDIQPYFNDGGDKVKMLSISNMGGVILGINSFWGCANLDITATDAPTMDVIIDSLFRNTNVLSGNSSFNDWDVSLVTDMDFAFSNADLFNIDLPDWDTSSVTTMEKMFQGNDLFNGNIGTWDVSSVENMFSMFLAATSFNQNLNWDVSSVTNMSSMFKDATSFNGTVVWDVSSVTLMNSLFNGASSFNQPLPWNTSSAINMMSMFRDASAFNQNLIWDTSLVTNMSSMFRDASAFNQDMSGLDFSSVTNMSLMLDNTAMSTANYDALLVRWDAQTITLSNFNIGVNGLTYTSAGAGGTARTSLIGKGWIFVGDSGV